MIRGFIAPDDPANELTEEQAHRIDRARLALHLHKMPAEIDRMSFRDFADLVEIMRADQEIERLKAHRQRLFNRR